MAKSFIPSVLTANHLLDGDTVWWTGAEWSLDIADAKVAGSPDAATELEALGGSAGFEAAVVGPYLVQVDTTGATPRPVVRREAIRADGRPTFVYGLEADALSKAA